MEPQKIHALTYDDGKPPLAWLPWAAMDEVAMVQEYGAKKYGTFLNYKKGLEASRNLSCAIRHIRDYMNGIDKDHESGRHPLGHAMCRIAFVLQNIRDGTIIDDRSTGPKAVQTLRQRKVSGRVLQRQKIKG